MTDIRTALEAFLRPWDTMSDEYLRSGAAAVEFGIETVGRVIAARAAISAASPEPEHHPGCRRRIPGDPRPGLPSPAQPVGVL